jgi:DNA-binding MarR family transcriptional regulator
MMMKIEDEIKQKSFKSEYQKLAVNLLFTHGWLVSFQKKLFENHEITNAQFNILRILRGQYPDPVSINILKERMLDKMSDTSRLVERLRVKGLVDRKICKEDRRKSDVKITEKGLELLKSLDHIDDSFQNIFNKLNIKEAKDLNNLLDKLRG